MGCDIHMIAEVHRGPGNWEIVPGPIITCWGCNGTGVNQSGHSRIGAPCDWCNKEFDSYDDGTGSLHTYRIRTYAGPGKQQDMWYADRNYNVFAHLADVRNYGGSNITPISQPRGFPEDLSKEAVSWFNEYGGEHSETWLTLDEVMAHDWNELIVHEGVVDVEQYRVFKANGKPRHWSGGVSGGTVVNISNTEMDAIAMGKTCGFKFCVNPEHEVAQFTGGSRFYTTVSWKERAATDCEFFLERMRELREVAGAGVAVRLTFNFDS